MAPPSQKLIFWLALATCCAEISAQLNTTRLTPAPAIPNPQIPVTPPSLLSSVFATGNQTVIRCPPGQVLTWYNRNWEVGGIRPYYEARGPKPTFDDCVRECGASDDCYFATFTRKKNCYFLTTTSPALCQYLNGAHFGTILERCGPLRPCPSAYKQCSAPRCMLLRILDTMCKTNDKQRALDTCTL